MHYIVEYQNRTQRATTFRTTFLKVGNNVALRHLRGRVVQKRGVGAAGPERESKGGQVKKR